MLFLAIVFISAATGKLGEMPSIEQLENPKTNLPTAIYSSDGVVLGKFYLNDNRTPISFSQLPDNIIEALIATDCSFFALLCNNLFVIVIKTRGIYMLSV